MSGELPCPLCCVSQCPLWRECEGQAHSIPVSRLSWQHGRAVPVPRGSWGMAAAQSSLLAGSPAGAFPGKPKAVDSFLNSPGRNSIVVIQDC